MYTSQLNNQLDILNSLAIIEQTQNTNLKLHGLWKVSVTVELYSLPQHE